MKRIFLILIVLAIAELAYSQAKLQLEDMKNYRIHLENRTNRHLKDVPKQLLDGYCTGLYKAYYPKSIYTEVNFGDFLAHFNAGEPLLNESMLCGDNYCSNTAFTELFTRFDACIDFYEQMVFNPSTSLTERKIIFLQLVYKVRVNEIDYTFKGPLMRMDEIDKTVMVKNDSNPNEPQSIKYTFDLGRFVATDITDEHLNEKKDSPFKGDDYQDN